MVEVFVTIGLIIATVAVIEVVGVAVIYLIELWGTEQPIPQSCEVEFSEHDEEMVKKTQNLMTAQFGENVTKRLAQASNKERIELTTAFAEQLAELYGLDIQIDVSIDQVQNAGEYDWNTRCASFNILLLTVDKDDEHFEYAVKIILDTIIHELRHAVQHKAIREEGFWDIAEERRIAWAENFINYVQPSVDIRAYSQQIIEVDAIKYAALCMEGYH